MTDCNEWKHFIFIFVYKHNSEINKLSFNLTYKSLVIIFHVKWLLILFCIYTNEVKLLGKGANAGDYIEMWYDRQVHICNCGHLFLENVQ